MNRALFLDRDGIINRELGRYVTSVDEFEILPTVIDALTLANNAGFLLIIVSNQGGVAKGLYTLEDVHAMQQQLDSRLRQRGAFITEGYYCPHHQDHGKCLCRKPSPLMLQKAMARFGIDPTASFLIGDSERDIVAATAAGVRGILLSSNTDIIHTVRELL
jgi:D-glycero-D-manno-heptose 1,7-bisphosphate phosphatase